MDEIRKGELQREISTIAKILIDCQECLKIVDFLLQPELDKDRNYTKRNFNFQFQSTIYWRIVVLELCKLLSPSRKEEFSLKKFIAKLKKDGYFSGARISENKIKEWEVQLAKDKAVVENLFQQRNKKYAHTAREAHEVVNTVSVKQARELVVIAQNILREIYFAIFESSYQIDDLIGSPVESLKHIIDSLVSDKKRKEQSLRKLAVAYGLEDEFK